MFNAGINSVQSSQYRPLLKRNQQQKTRQLSYVQKNSQKQNPGFGDNPLKLLKIITTRPGIAIIALLTGAAIGKCQATYNVWSNPLADLSEKEAAKANQCFRAGQGVFIEKPGLLGAKKVRCGEMFNVVAERISKIPTIKGH